MSWFVAYRMMPEQDPASGRQTFLTVHLIIMEKPVSNPDGDAPLQLPGDDAALDYLFRDETERESRSHSLPWRACVADAESLDDMDYGACIDAVAIRCNTLVGSRAAAEVMLRPVCDRDLLAARMLDVRLLATSVVKRKRAATNSGVGNVSKAPSCVGASSIVQIRDVVKESALAERNALWCSLSPDDIDHDTREALGEPYFRGGPDFVCRPLNSCWPLLYACGAYNAYAVPVMAMASPLIYLLTPYFIIRWKMNLPITPGMYVRIMYHAMMGSGSALRFAMGSPLAAVLQLASLAATALMYVQGVTSTLRSSSRLREVSARISEATVAARKVVSCAGVLSAEASRICGPGFLDRWIPPSLAERPAACDSALMDTSDAPVAAPLWKKESAVALARYARMDRGALRSAFLAVAAVDLVLALGTLLKEGQGQYCQPELVGCPASPLVAVKDGWCPGTGGRDGDTLEMKSQVPNDAALAWPGRRGILLTGANATGKSTALRVLGCCALMAQSVGVAPARAAALTPLGYLCTMMRVRDSPERGLSRFQAELMRAGHCMDSATEGAAAGRGGLILLDEVFAGSSDSRSSDACGVRVLEVLSGCSGALVVLSTHQDSLADWAEGRLGFASFMTEPHGYKLVRGRNSASNAVEQMSKFGRQTSPP